MNDITEITGNMIMNVGLAFNDLDPIRVDPEGKMSNAGLEIDEKGPYAKQLSSPLVELVHVDDLTGGTATIIANNKLNFIVGAGGVKFQTAGVTEFGGALTNIAGEQVNISSSNEVNVTGGARLNLEGKILSLKSGSGQVCVEGTLSVTGNMMVQGGAMINGPLHCNGISAPMTIQETEELQEMFGTTNDKVSKIIGYWLKNTTFEVEVTGDSSNMCVYAQDGDANLGKMKSGGRFKIKPTSDIIIKTIGDSGPDTDSVRVYPHSHLFRNIPVNLTGNVAENFKSAKSLTGGSPMAPMEIKNGKMGPNPDTNVNSKKNYETNAKGSEKGKSVYVDL
jgi:hypothetical protein